MSEAQTKLDEIAAIYTEARTALRAQAEAGEITVEKFRDDLIALGKEARKRADAIRDATQRRRDQLDQLVCRGARSGWAKDQAGEWRLFVEVDYGHWLPMP